MHSPYDFEGLSLVNERAEVIALVVAVASNGLIGRDGELPWHLPDDLRYFRKITINRPVIMGRKTFLSIGAPLPNRWNIVLTRDPEWSALGVHTAHSFNGALRIARQFIAPMEENPEIMVIGGADIFALALPQARRLYLTEVHQHPEGNVYFPSYERDKWHETWRQAGQADEKGQITHHFVVLERKSIL